MINFGSRTLPPSSDTPKSTDTLELSTHAVDNVTHFKTNSMSKPFRIINTQSQALQTLSCCWQGQVQQLILHEWNIF